VTYPLYTIKYIYLCALHIEPDKNSVSPYVSYCLHYCKQYLVCINVLSILHTTKCVYQCVVPIAPGKIWVSLCQLHCAIYNVSLYHSFATEYKLSLPVQFLLHEIKSVYRCGFFIATDNSYHCKEIGIIFDTDKICLSLCRFFCTRYNIYITVPFLLQQTQCMYNRNVLIEKGTMCDSAYLSYCKNTMFVLLYRHYWNIYKV